MLFGIIGRGRARNEHVRGNNAWTSEGGGRRSPASAIDAAMAPDISFSLTPRMVQCAMNDVVLRREFLPSGSLLLADQHETPGMPPSWIESVVPLREVT